MATRAHKPLTSRPLDLVYTVWFVIHILITVFVDMVPFYPHALQLPILLKIRQDYIRDWRDPLVISWPAWFRAFLIVEGLYQAPLCVWGIGALRDDRPTAPVHLLVYAVETAVSTMTCLVELFASTAVTWDEKVSLAWLYGAWAVVPGLIGVDMFIRIRRKLLASDKALKSE